MQQTFATVTQAGRLILPKPVRHWLGVTSGGHASFRASGAAIEVRSASADEVRLAALAPFLALMDADLRGNPSDAVAALPLALIACLCPLSAARSVKSGSGSDKVGAPAVLVRSGWRLAFHPLLQAQLTALCDTGASRDGRAAADAPLRQAVSALMFDRVPANPMLADFDEESLQGWRRAQCANGRLSLFFRADPDARIILFAWIEDRARKAPLIVATDPCVLFGAVSTVTAGGHAVLPMAVRERQGMTAGGRVEFGLARGTLLMRAQTAPGHDGVLAGLADVMDDAAALPKAPLWRDDAARRRMARQRANTGHGSRPELGLHLPG